MNRTKSRETPSFIREKVMIKKTAVLLTSALLILVATSNASLNPAQANSDSRQTVENNGAYNTHYLYLAVNVYTHILDQHTETYSIDGGRTIVIPLQDAVKIHEGYWLQPPTYQCTVALPYLADGSHTITIYGSEPWIPEIYKGQYYTYQHTINFTIDTTHIAITNLSVKNQTYTSESSITLDCATNKTAAWMGYSLDGNETITFSGNTTLLALTDGSHALTVYANDTAGNTCSETVYFIVESPTKWLLPAAAILVAPIAVVGLAFIRRKRSK